MTRAAKLEKVIIDMKDPSAEKGKLKCIGGSQSDDFNNIIANQAIQTLWTKHSDKEGLNTQYQALLASLMGIAPRDELEGMLATQMVAAHAASIECYRRAMLHEQTFEGRKENLTQANKLSRTYTMLLEALNRHRGKGQQKVTVEHVHVHAGGQAIVGAVQSDGVPSGTEQPNAKQLTHAPQSPLWGENAKREAVQVASDAEWPLPDARGPLSRRPKG
jgi:hypothetical protein